MKRYVLALCLALSSFLVFANDSKLVGEKNENTSNDQCYKPNIIGCGPCFKKCMSQNSSQYRGEVTNLNPKAKKAGGKQSTTAQ